jgi:hypothetical protein
MNMADKREEQLERMRDALDEKNQEARARSTEKSIEAADRPPDVGSPRAKSTGHGKKTADKWNQ